MDIGTEIEKVVAAGTPEGIGKRDYGAILNTTARSLKAAISRPQRDQAGPELLVEMIVVRAQAPQVSSVSLGNLFRQLDPTNPRFIKDALSAGSAAAGLAIIGAGPLFAFIVAVTVLATRAVPRPEAMTLHLAWRIARADGSFTLPDMVERAEQLRDEYEVDKVSENDILSYLNNLARAGSLRSTTRGYEVVEVIKIIDF